MSNRSSVIKYDRNQCGLFTRVECTYWILLNQNLVLRHSLFSHLTKEDQSLIHVPQIYFKMFFIIWEVLYEKRPRRTATLLKKKLWHRCFSVNFAKFLRTLFLQNTSGRLLLHKHPWLHGTSLIPETQLFTKPFFRFMILAPFQLISIWYLISIYIAQLISVELVVVFSSLIINLYWRYSL